MSGFAAALVAGTTTVIVDFSATTFCDTAGLREMVLAKRLALATRIDLRLVVPGSLTRIFKLTGLDGVIPLYPTLGEALAPDSAADEGEHPA